jgi:hypothetical protein
MRELIVAAAGPRLDTDTRETWLRRAADIAGASYRQTRALYYGEISHGPTFEKFKAAAVRDGRENAGRLAHQFDLLVAKLGRGNSAVSRDDLALLLRAARKLRGIDRS